MQLAELIVSILGFGGAIAALIFGLRQYRRSEQWKRSEFVAKEIKEFEGNPEIRNAFFMIDWGIRKINLFHHANPAESDLVRVTRETQWRALVPHPIKPKHQDPSATWDEQSQSETKVRFTPVEAAIRDTYDAFLSYLERFAHYMQSGLVTAEEFRPYLIYWINSIADVGGEDNYDGDIEWRCALLAFINYYDYKGVTLLFESYGWDIKPGGKVFKTLGKQMKNKNLLADCEDVLAQKKAEHGAQSKS